MRLRWWPIPLFEVSGDLDAVAPNGPWRAHGEFRWQLVHREYREASPGVTPRPEHFELTCFAVRNLRGWSQPFSSLEEAKAEAERLEELARNRRQVLGHPYSRDVVLWPERWEIVATSQEFTDQWVCPSCGTDLPAYLIETNRNGNRCWICSSCSMPFDLRESPERHRLTSIELARLEAKELESEFGIGVTALEDRQFFIEEDIDVSAVHSLRHVWLPPAAATRTVLCCEKDEDGQLRWLIFVNEQEKLAILVEADGGEASYLGYFVDFVEPIERLRLISRWDYESGWVDQLPDPQVFWLEDGVLRDDPDNDTRQIEELLFPDQKKGA